LGYCGFSGMVKDWAINYPSGKAQFIQVNDYKSDFRRIDCRIPLGSVLGFLQYLNKPK